MDDGVGLREAQGHCNIRIGHMGDMDVLYGPELPEGARGRRSPRSGAKAARGRHGPETAFLVAEPLSETGLSRPEAAGNRRRREDGPVARGSSGAIGDYDARRPLGYAGRSGAPDGREEAPRRRARGRRPRQRRREGRHGPPASSSVNTPSGNIVSAAEHAIALLLSLLRRMPEAQASLKAGEWKRTKFVGTELQGRTVGLVGLGQVGSRVAARLKPWNVPAPRVDPFVTPERAAELGVERVSLDDLLRPVGRRLPARAGQRGDEAPARAPKTRR